MTVPVVWRGPPCKTFKRRGSALGRIIDVPVDCSLGQTTQTQIYLGLQKNAGALVLDQEEEKLVKSVFNAMMAVVKEFPSTLPSSVPIPAWNEYPGVFTRTEYIGNQNCTPSNIISHTLSQDAGHCFDDDAWFLI